MVQTVKSVVIATDCQKILFEKPHTKSRIFFSVKVMASSEAWAESRLSFDDPMFYSYYTLAGPVKFFEAKGEGIFQGGVWVRNISGGDILYNTTEILI